MRLSRHTSRLLGFQIPPMFVQDLTVRCALGRNARVMKRTQVIRSALERIMADPPTPLGVTVHPAHPGIDADADRTDKCRLSKVRAEARPEVVIDRIAGRVDRARMNGRPMAKEVEVRDQQREAGEEEEADHHDEGLSQRVSFGIEKIELSRSVCICRILKALPVLMP